MDLSKQMEREIDDLMIVQGFWYLAWIRYKGYGIQRTRGVEVSESSHELFVPSGPMRKGRSVGASD